MGRPEHGLEVDHLGTRLDSDGRPYGEGDLETTVIKKNATVITGAERAAAGSFGDDVLPEASRGSLYQRTAARREIKKRAQQEHRAHRTTYKRRRKRKRRQPKKRGLGWWLTPPR